jgi:hypothetical protein
MGTAANPAHREPWNKGKIVGQKAPFKLKDIWALRVRLQMEDRVRELALFYLGIDSKLRGCELVALKVRDVCHGDKVATRAIVLQHKTHRPVQFEITAATREALQAWIEQAGRKPEDFLFPSRLHDSHRRQGRGVDLDPVDGVGQAGGERRGIPEQGVASEHRRAAAQQQLPGGGRRRRVRAVLHGRGDRLPRQQGRVGGPKGKGGGHA